MIRGRFIAEMFLLRSRKTMVRPTDMPRQAMPRALQPRSTTIPLGAVWTYPTTGPQTGFYLNGKPLKIQGMCNHQDHAGVGIALPDRIHEYRIERLKEMGCNAYRCAHNPPAPELLDACDRLGLLVMDETRLMAATPQGRHELEHMILRDRNHPCIILWSMGNEEPIQNTESGARILRSMVRHAHRLDPTRPTTAAVTGGWGNAFSLALDVEGINYSINQYDPYHKNNPEHPLLSSEHAAAVTTRGIYTNDLAKGHLSSYDPSCMCFRTGIGAGAKGRRLTSGHTGIPRRWNCS